ncbi:CAP domain-containing protein [Obelidium mucronatum]|nr:CAP domain-containing protein [Obelidium mucronatum]
MVFHRFYALCVTTSFVNAVWYSGSFGHYNPLISLEAIQQTVNCENVAQVGLNDTCGSIAATFAMTIDSFATLNPKVRCERGRQLNANSLVCVTIPKPTSNLVCDHSYSLSAGDSCDTVSALFGLSPTHRLILNPNLNCFDSTVNKSICLEGHYAGSTSSIGHAVNLTTSTWTLAESCTNTTTIAANQTCVDISSASNISVTRLGELNHGLGNCWNLPSDKEICVAGSSSSSSTATTVTSIEPSSDVPSPTPSPPAPEPQQPAETAEPQSPPPPPPPPPSQNTGLSGNEISALLSLHNNFRARNGVSQSLSWNSAIANQATDWANHLAASQCMLEHGNTNGVGQNLAMMAGTPGFFTPTMDALFNGWASECLDCGLNHATQAAWASTTSVGCGLSWGTWGGMTCVVLACDYSPPGNWVGRSWRTG